MAGGMRYEVRGTSAFSGRPIAARFAAPEAGNPQLRSRSLRLVACRKSVPAVQRWLSDKALRTKYFYSQTVNTWS